ncbi:hypothetical protein BBR47_55120 [Brevibacillus brevis NBRC 100599]|uniref:Uncharacterized protein n=1 Tax=Brevibacillus brevis (strain 47 / JCM 6285 / NBRC 100599) TaxID=358681 RepID=C0Z862_BREBN|nr:hypothetical protein BBR47_55120 [Brevibacillus brevis NBRC 100599]
MTKTAVYIGFSTHDGKAAFFIIKNIHLNNLQTIILLPFILLEKRTMTQFAYVPSYLSMGFWVFHFLFMSWMIFSMPHMIRIVTIAVWTAMATFMTNSSPSIVSEGTINR